VVFDLDDTLYLECDYVRSGFQHVAQLAAKSAEEAPDLAAWLWAAFEQGVRGDTFNRLLSAHPTVAARFTPAELVDAYRSHAPSIAFLPGIPDLLARLRARHLRLGVLSDGALISQRAKAKALGLEEWFDPVLLTASRGDAHVKPGTGGFEWIAAAWGLPHAQLAYIADNPLKDFVAPRKLGWLTVRLRIPRQLHFGLEPIGNGDQSDIELADPMRLLDVLG
jgi:putative hydrolase of the HAD superfamily